VAQEDSGVLSSTCETNYSYRKNQKSSGNHDTDSAGSSDEADNREAKREKKREKRDKKREKKMEEKMKKREKKERKKERKKEKKRELKRENRLLHLRLQTLQLEMANSDKNLDEQVDVNSCCSAQRSQPSAVSPARSAQQS
jgi:hypothetical protein